MSNTSDYDQTVRAVRLRFIFRCYEITLQQRELRTELQVLLQRISLYRYFYEHIFMRDSSTGLGYKVELQNYRITGFIYITILL